MKVEIVYSEHCDHCHELLEMLEKQSGIEGMNIDFIEINTDRGQKLLNENSIQEVPTVLDSNGDKCEIIYGDNKVDFICPVVSNI